MNDAIIKFKKVIAQVGDDCGINFGRHGLRDLLLEVNVNTTAAELVAKAAIYFCKEGDNYNGSDAGMMVVMQFLFETGTSLPSNGEEDAAVELMRLLNGGAKYDAILTRPTKVRFQKSGMGKTKVSQGEIAPAGTFVGRVNPQLGIVQFYRD